VEIKIINKEFTMILFDKGFMLNDWRAVYVGLKKHWFTPDEVLSYCEYGYILCSEEMFTEMYMSSELSDENLLNITRKIYPNPIWEKIALDKDKRYKLDEVGFLYANFNYPDDWYHLIYYNPPKKGEKTGIDVLYEDILKYIDDSTKQLIESKTIKLKKV